MTDENKNTPAPKDAEGDNNGQDGAAGAGATAGNNGDAGAGGGDAPSVYRPEGIADHLVGKTDQETIDNLHKTVANFRKDLSKKGVPENPDGYELDLPDDLKDKVLHLDKDGKDPAFEAIKPIAHKYGIPKDALSGFISEVYPALLAQSGTGDGTDGDGGEFAADFDFKSLGGADKAAPQIEGATVWVDGLERNGKITPAIAKELKLMTTHSEGLQALLAVRGLTGEAKIPARVDGDTPPDGITEESVRARVNDPQYWNDPEFRAETTRQFEALYAEKKS